MISANSFKDNRFDEFPDAAWAVTVPPTYNKTKLLYKWPVPAEMEWMILTLKKLHARVPTLRETLGDPKRKFSQAIVNYYKNRVMPDAVDEEKVGSPNAGPEGEGDFYSLKTIRARHGTEYVKAFFHAQREGLPTPFCPLQHTNIAMTLKHYNVAEGEAPTATIDERRQAKRRLKEQTILGRSIPATIPTMIVTAPRKSARQTNKE